MWDAIWLAGWIGGFFPCTLGSPHSRAPETPWSMPGCEMVWKLLQSYISVILKWSLNFIDLYRYRDWGYSRGSWSDHQTGIQTDVPQSTRPVPWRLQVCYTNRTTPNTMSLCEHPGWQQVLIADVSSILLLKKLWILLQVKSSFVIQGHMPKKK